MLEKWKRTFRAGLAVLPLALMLTACASVNIPIEEPLQQELQLIENETAVEAASEAVSEAPSEAVTNDQLEADVTEATTEVVAEAEPAPAIDEKGSYDQKEDVALYLVTYHHLPSNYITKKQAQKLGWEGGRLEEYAPGCSIGGDYFGNYEGLLPEDVEYHECDIDATGRKRGAKRIIYSEDWKIYYTDDHYDSFEQLY